MSGPVDLGQTYRYRHAVTDSSGAPADAGTVTVTITLPDGTTAGPSVVHTATGIYDVAYTTVQAGRHDVSGDATGGILGTEHDVWDDVFTVEQPRTAFVGVDEASAHLRASGVIVSVADREQLRWLCRVACDAVERDLGRVISRRTVTETHDGGRVAIVLRSTPLISVTTVTESGTTVAATDYTADATAGIVYRGGQQSPRPWLWGRQNVAITYVAGWVSPPQIVRKVALNGVERMWQASQQAPHGDLAAAIDGGSFVAAGTLTPLELGAYSSLRAPGIA